MNDIPTALRNLARQEQFLDVVGSAEATARFHRHLKLRPLGSEIAAAVASAGSRAGTPGSRRCRCAGLRPRECRRVCRARRRYGRRQRGARRRSSR